MRIGYACINLSLAEQKLQVNRGMVKRTFLSKGISYASELALKNITDFSQITDWNIEKGLSFYRMSSDMFPWMSEYEIPDLPDFQIIKNILILIGKKVKANNLRLTFHPGPFNVLASSDTHIIRKTAKELRQHAEIMDIIGLPESPFAKINIHVGATYGNKNAAISRFAENFRQLPENVRKRLTIENDDKVNMYSVGDLLPLHELTGIPVVFDYLHHKLCPGRLSEKEAMLTAYETWPEGITPVVHYSSSRKKFEDPEAIEAAHADYIYDEINLYGKEVDIMLEAKAKEYAVFRYLQEFSLKEI
jgi:UV DNA damage endonuclease